MSTFQHKIISSMIYAISGILTNNNTNAFCLERCNKVNSCIISIWLKKSSFYYVTFISSFIIVITLKGKHLHDKD